MIPDRLHFIFCTLSVNGSIFWLSVTDRNRANESFFLLCDGFENQWHTERRKQWWLLGDIQTGFYALELQNNLFISLLKIDTFLHRNMKSWGVNYSWAAAVACQCLCHSFPFPPLLKANYQTMVFSCCETFSRGISACSRQESAFLWWSAPPAATSCCLPRRRAHSQHAWRRVTNDNPMKNKKRKSRWLIGWEIAELQLCVVFYFRCLIISVILASFWGKTFKLTS